MSDARMLSVLCSSPKGGELAERLRKRRLYKKAHGVPLSKLRGNATEIEEELSAKCGCEVLLDLPRLSAETRIMLEKDGHAVPLARQSELVASLQKMQKSRLEALVICEEKNIKKVSQSAQKLLG